MNTGYLFAFSVIFLQIKIISIIKVTSNLNFLPKNEPISCFQYTKGDKKD